MSVDTTPHRLHIFSLPTFHSVSHFQWDNLMLHFKHLETDAGACAASHFVVRCLMFGSRALWAQDVAFIPSSRICVTFVSASFRKSACHRMTLLCDFHATTFCSTPPLPIPVSSSSPTTRISSTTTLVGTQHSTVGATPHVGAPAGFLADIIHDTHTQLAHGRPRTFAVAAAKTTHSYLSALGGMRCANQGL